tara:strand:- start:3737 stop:3955 length:219 start_codon:yes stop_codon:yes gene_type:complete
MKKKLKIEEEAKQYRQEKIKPPIKTKPLTARRFMAGQAMAALLARSQGHFHMSDIKREAYDWADFMLDEDAE